MKKQKHTTIFWVIVLMGIAFIVGFISKTAILPEVSILKEKKDCEEWGGKMSINSQYGKNKFEITTELICKKHYTQDNKDITETLFDYEISE